MLGSAMNIWCSRQQMRHCTSLRSLSRPPSISAPSELLLPLASRLPSFGLSDGGALTPVSGFSLSAPSCCSSDVGRHTSNRIWTAALSWWPRRIYTLTSTGRRRVDTWYVLA